MCILFIYRNPDAAPESYRLILAANRDEYFKRPALPAHYWPNLPECLGGTDMEPGKEGGTWLAMSKKGKAAVILNLTNEGSADTEKKGRGSLITDYISSDISADNYLDKLHKENQNGQPYNPYNMVLIDLHTIDVSYLNSSINSKGPTACKDTILGFGNSYLEVPFKKVEAGKEKFTKIVNNAKTAEQNTLIEEILKFLKSPERHLPDPELQRRCPTKYKELSSIFVSIPVYGTRTHSVLLVTGTNEVTFVEETLMPDKIWQRQVFNVNLVNNEKCCK